jgi:chitinase
MKQTTLILTTLCLFLMGCSKKVVTAATGGSDSTTSQEETKILVSGYVPDYGMNRFDLKNLVYLDRVNYFAIEPDANGIFQMSVADSTNIELIKTKLNSQQQLFLVIGGWVNSQNIPAMASDPNKRNAYIQEVVAFCKRRGINGVDLDWEDYPGPVNQAVYVTLVKEFYRALHARGILFTVALGASKADWGYKIKDDVDQINLMIYGGLDVSGNQSTMLQMKNTLTSFADPGIPKAKLLAGVPFYGKRAAAPVALEYYNFVAQSQPAPSVNRFGDYSYNGRTLLQDKTAFLRQNGYGGIMIWEVTQDVSVTSEFSLLKSIYDRNK